MKFRIVSIAVMVLAGPAAAAHAEYVCGLNQFVAGNYVSLRNGSATSYFEVQRLGEDTELAVTDRKGRSTQPVIPPISLTRSHRQLVCSGRLR